ncbi:MAG: hypothetical protein DRN20_06415, partial [Thermoplasmata archaeon]
MKEKMNERRKVIGIAIAVIMVASILAVIAPQAFGYYRPVPIPTGEEGIYYLSPPNITVSVPGGCKEEVQLHVNVSGNITGGKIKLTYDPSCAVISCANWTMNNTLWGGGGTCVVKPEERALVITYFAAAGVLYPPGDYHIGNLTICCNSTVECCRFDFGYVTTETYYSNLTGDYEIPLEASNFTCGKPSITVEKKVYDPATGTWVDSLSTAKKGEEYRFRIDVTASACANFTNLVVNDTLSGVIVANCTSVSPPPVSCSDTFIQWTFPTLNASETKTLYFNATVTDYGMGVDKASATAY